MKTVFSAPFLRLMEKVGFLALFLCADVSRFLRMCADVSRIAHVSKLVVILRHFVIRPELTIRGL